MLLYSTARHCTALVQWKLYTKRCCIRRACNGVLFFKKNIMSKLKKQDGIPFTQINNDLINDTRLSAKAKWIYCYLYSKPDDWDFSCERIAKDFEDWQKWIESGVRELELCWWIKRERQNNWKMLYTIYRTTHWAKEPNSLSGGWAAISKKEYNKDTSNSNNSSNNKKKETLFWYKEPTALVPEPTFWKENINLLLEHFKKCCEKVGLQYMPGYNERGFAKHILSKKLAEEIAKYNMTLDNFIENIITLSAQPYMKPCNTPQLFYQNWGHVINASKAKAEAKKENTKWVVYLS